MKHHPVRNLLRCQPSLIADDARLQWRNLFYKNRNLLKSKNKHCSISSQVTTFSFTAFCVMICDSYFSQWVWWFYVLNLDCVRKFEKQMQMLGSGIDVLPAPTLPAPPPSHDCSSVELGHHCRNADLFSALAPSKHTFRKFLSRIFFPNISKYWVRTFNNAVRIETPARD
jgi:hypothetical protein